MEIGSDEIWLAFRDDIDVDPLVAQFVRTLQLRNASRNTLKAYVPRVIRFLNWCLEKHIQWERINATELGRYHEHLRSTPTRKGNVPESRTINAHWDAITAFYRFAAHSQEAGPTIVSLLYETAKGADSNWANQPPAERKRYFRERPKEDEFTPITPSDIRALLQVLHSDRDKLIILLAQTTGLRIGELLALQITDFHANWDNRESGCSVTGAHVHVRAAASNGRRDVRGKSRKSRLVPLQRITVAALDACLQERRLRRAHGSPFVFVNLTRGDVGAPMTYSNIEQIIRRARVRADVRNITLHSHRHAFATNLVQTAKAGIPVAMELLGHASPESTAIYVHPSEADRRDAVRRANRHFDGIER